MADLTKYVDAAKVTALNYDKSTKPESIFGGQGLIKSDTDEQLLIVVPFTEEVKIRHISFSAEGKEGIDSAPKIVKIFKNAESMEFEEAEDTEPTAQLDLSADDLKNAEKLKLKFTKFQDVNSITIFVESNQGDEDVSFLSNVTFYGQSKPGTNMKELKKAG
eukprot:jgi/Bigna1/89178/estExt_fgenesh1_pg.C_450017